MKQQIQNLVNYISDPELPAAAKEEALKGFTANLILNLAKMAEGHFNIDVRGRAYEVDPLADSIARKIRDHLKELEV